MSNKKINPHSWIYISLVGFIIFAAVLSSLMFAPKTFSFSTPVYFFLLVVLALVATGFLAGAMNSYAKYNSTVNNRHLTITGPAVIFFVILYIGYKFRPDTIERPVSLSIIVTGPDNENEVLENGEIAIRIADYRSQKKLGAEGEVVFSGIDATYKGLPIQVFPKIEGYILDTSQSFTLSEETNNTNLTIRLKRVSHLIRIYGKVIYLKDQVGIAQAKVRFEGTDSTFITDESGDFQATLPIKSGTELRIMINKNAHLIYNSTRVLTDKALLTFPVSE